MAHWTYTLLVMLVLFVPVTATAGEGNFQVDDGKVYYGDAGAFEKPAVICISKVFDAIPEYTDARKKGKEDPQYYILLEKANQKFFSALEKVAGEGGYDLIAERGSVKAKKGKVPDVTDEVVKALPN